MRFLSIFILFASTVSIGQKYIRFNHVGYTPDRKKEFILMSNENCKGQPYKVLNKKGETVSEGEIGGNKAGASGHSPFSFHHVITLNSIKDTGSYQLKIEGAETANFRVDQDPYSFVTSDILRYIKVHRSGTSDCHDHKASHMGDKRCEIYRRTGDNSSWKATNDMKSLDMRGGWYDAGDYIKFTLTSAYACYLILRSYEVNPALFDQKKYSQSDLVDILDEAKHGLDWLSKTNQDPDEFVIQVGGSKDHQEGNRLPQHDLLNGSRECYSAKSPTQMGYTVAALALGAKIFSEQGKEELSKKYSEAAHAIYAEAKTATDPAWVKHGWEEFYKDNTAYDNLELAAVEMYNLTKEKQYLTDAKSFGPRAGRAHWASWGSSHLLAHMRLMDHNKIVIEEYMGDMDMFLGIANDPDNIWGVPHNYTWGTLYSFLEVANGAMLNNLKRPNKAYQKLYLDVLDYTLGRNNWGISFVASPQIPNSIRNVYNQIYKLKPKLYPTGAIAEGPGDTKTHNEVVKYFQMKNEERFEPFNTNEVVFYDDNTNFQTMETTITGLADGLFFFTLASTLTTK